MVVKTDVSKPWKLATAIIAVMVPGQDSDNPLKPTSFREPLCPFSVYDYCHAMDTCREGPICHFNC
jgi:hypothetical protein